MKKTRIITTLLILIAISIGGIYLTMSKQKDGYSYNQDGVAINPDPNHTHADFALFARGKQFDFSEERFMANQAGDDHEDDGHAHDTMHLHDEVGHVIHRHKPGQTLGNFLDSIGFNTKENCITTDTGDAYCTTDSEAWRMYVNGTETDVDMEYVFADEDKILLSFGASDADVEVQLQQMTDDSCIYSKTCPERGEAPPENCVADPEVPCTIPLDNL